jgi:hypothetical protein
MNRMNRAATSIVLVTLFGCGGSDTPPASPPPPTATGCVAGTERITKISGDGQTAAPAALLPERPTVRVTCESSANRGTTMPMTGAAVQWQVWTRGLVDGATNVQKQLDADGTTSVAWTLPNGFGAQAVRVTVAGVSPPLLAEFNAAVTATTTTAQSCQDAGGTDHGAVTVIVADAAWTAADSPHRGGTIMLDNAAVLSIEAGAVVCVTAIDKLGDTGAVIAEGTASAPIRFFGTALRVADVLSHVRAENVPSVGSAHIEDSTFRWTVPRDPLMCAQIVVSGSASGAEATLRRSLIAGYGSPDCAALRVTSPQYAWGADSAEFSVRVADSVGDAVLVDPGSWVDFTACEVSGSGRHGIVVGASTDSYVGVTGCNLFDNDGDAVVNQTTVSVRARGNWWGDVTGPGGPNGDRVSGLVDTANPLAAPVTLDYWAGPPVTAAGCVAGTERVTKISGDSQTAAPGALLPERPTVRATCESFANRGTTMPMAGAAVQWQVWLGRGRIDGATTVPKQLDADGVTSVAWTLPNGYGAQAVRVTVAGVSPPLLAEFSATVAATTTTAQSCQDAGGTDHGAATVIAADAAWTAAGSPHRGGTIMLDNAAVLSIEAGAVICVTAIDRIGNSGTVLAEGTASAPIRFFGTALSVADVLSHVRAENVPFVGTTHPASHIADSTFRWTVQRDPLLCAQIVVSGSASGTEGTLRRTHIEDYGSAGCAALRLIQTQNVWDYGDGPEFSVRVVGSVGDAVSVEPGTWVAFTACEVSGSGRHGIVVGASTDSYVGITGCNLHDNDGDAVVNQSTNYVGARRNWWGDAAGPNGPNGDRVSGLVDAANPLAAPATFGY